MQNAGLKSQLTPHLLSLHSRMTKFLGHFQAKVSPVRGSVNVQPPVDRKTQVDVLERYYFQCTKTLLFPL